MQTNITMQQLKQQRFSQAVKFVNDTIKDVESGSLSDGCVYWFKGGVRLFIQDFKHRNLTVTWSEFVFYLYDYYNLSISEIEQLLTKLLHKYTDNGNLKIGFIFA